MPVPSSSPKPELLAPAGSLEAFFAAMDSGADAVYVGLRDFSARARAKNFTPHQLEQMLAYAHAHNRRVYVTLNTLIKEQELPQVVDTLAALAGMGADGVIVQDLAVARLARHHFPALPLHASTQMTIHNTPGIQMLEQLGFQRAVLARELGVDEVVAITRATPVETEIFVHGALCFSISGQCFFSSYLGGHSGNRGRCAQPCRRLYSHRGKEGHYFSTSDLSAAELVPALAQAGVSSLKIEGRMKSAEYVASVVEAYRLLLDTPQEEFPQALKQAKELLKGSFGRTPTKGFLASDQPDDIANPWQKGGTGRFVGKITGIKGNRLLFDSRDSIKVGDRLRVQPATDMAGQAWTVRELFSNRKKVMETREKATVEVECPFTFSVGDTVFKVSSREAYTLSDNACQRRLDSVKGGQIPCRLHIGLEQEELVVNAETGGEHYPFRFPVGLLEPSRTSDMAGVLRGQFSKTGDTPFTLVGLDAPEFPPVLIPMGRLKEIRRSLYHDLAQAITGSRSQRITRSRSAALKELATSSPSVASPCREILSIIMEHPKDFRYALQQGADTVILPLTRAAQHQLPSVLPRMRDLEERIVWQLPFILFDRELPFYRETLRTLYQNGFRRFEATNLSHVALCAGLEGIRISLGYRCFSLNSQALAQWGELGAETATLYLEDDSRNMVDLLALTTPIQRRVIMYAPVPVMTTKIRVKEAHAHVPLTSDRGESYRIASRDGLQTILATTPYSLTARHQELLAHGCRSFLIDLSEAPRDQWDTIISAFKQNRSLPGTTEFNYPAELV